MNMTDEKVKKRDGEKMEIDRAKNCTAFEPGWDPGRKPVTVLVKFTTLI